MTEPRSLQTAIGPSEVGVECDRRLAYKAAGTANVNFPDPLRAMSGSGMHEVLAGYFRRLDGGSGRYLVEQKVTYRGLSGSVDLYDRRRKVLVDWKSPLKAKVRKVPTDGPSHNYVTQVHIYGAGLLAAGEEVEHVALAYVPPDGTLNDMRLWSQRLNIALADKAIDRWESIRDNPDPASTTATPSRLCGWCPFYRPNSTNLNVACSGAK